jgi:hypothetical protein
MTTRYKAASFPFPFEFHSGDEDGQSCSGRSSHYDLRTPTSILYRICGSIASTIMSTNKGEQAWNGDYSVIPSSTFSEVEHDESVV